MSTRRLRARLDRLMQSANSTTEENKARACDFTIDPALAEALRDDRKRLDELHPAYVDFPRIKPRRTEEEEEDEEEEEIRMLRARIAERASTISCPAGYGIKECRDDERRLRDRDRVKYSDAEEAQMVARIEAFKQTPEGRERARINELRRKWGWKSQAEHSELERLITLYPDPDMDPNDLMKDAEKRRRDAESDQRIFERANFLRSRR